MQKSKELAMLPLRPDQSSVGFTEEYFDVYHDFPKRPAWQTGWSKERLEMNEQREFRKYVTKMLNTDIHIPKSTREISDSDEESIDSTIEEEEEEESDTGPVETDKPG